MMDMEFGTVGIAVISSIVLGVTFWIIHKITNI